MSMTNEEKVEQYRAEADAMEQLANDVISADSIAEEVPVLSELFHSVRTSPRSSRDGRYVALLDWDESEGWTCRSVQFLDGGAHLRPENGATVTVAVSPRPFLSVDVFADVVSSRLRQQEEGARQNAASIEEYL
jgi:hypothetical protein